MNSVTALPLGVSVVIPAFRSARSLPELTGRIRDVLQPLRLAYEVLIVEDGGDDATWEVIAQVAAVDPEVRGIRLGRNAGQHAALLAGLRDARFAITVTLDDDLQNPPEEIPRLLEELEQQELDLVYGAPVRRSTTLLRRAGSGLLRSILTRLAGFDPAQLSPFRAFRTRLRDAGRDVAGPRVVLDVILRWGTDRIGHVEVEHHRRTDGRSGYSIRRLIGFAFDIITGYSTRPLRATAWLGFLSAGFGVVVLVYVVGRYLTTGISVAGFPFLASTIALFAGAQLVALGVIGEYLARMHVRILGQPSYVVAERIGGRPPGEWSPG